MSQRIVVFYLSHLAFMRNEVRGDHPQYLGDTFGGREAKFMPLCHQLCHGRQYKLVYIGHKRSI